MSTRLALILTGIWTAIVIAACGGGIWFVITKVPQHQQEERSRLLSGGIGSVAAIGYVAILVPWAAAWARKRHQAKQKAHQDREKDTPPPRRRKGGTNRE